MELKQSPLLPVLVVILMHTQAEKISAVLDSVAWAEHILLVDHNSQANIAALTAGRSNLEVISLDLKGPITDFSAVRQSLTDRCSHPWIFFVDSDEVVSISDWPTFAKQLDDTTLVGLSVKRSDVFLNKKLEYGEAGNQLLLRCMRPAFATWHNHIHEIAQVEGRTESAPVELAHYAHDSISSFITDIIPYAHQVALSTPTANWKNTLQLLLFPPAKVLYTLVVQAGFMDGWQGVVYAYCMSLHSLMVRVFRYEHAKQVE